MTNLQQNYPPLDLADFIAALRRREAYPRPPRCDITVMQTHISVLFFTDVRVYKVKKPIRLDFLDYSSLERRRRFCEEEVRLNRRLAPGVYLGVVPIVRCPDGAIRIDGTGETVEYAVEMVRLPEDRMMSAVLERGEIDNGRIDAIAQRLAGFHRDAPTGPGVDEFGDPARIAAEVEENFEALTMFAGDGDGPASGPKGTLSPALRDHLQSAARRWIDDHLSLMDQRVRDGRIREGHGDMHTGNICLADDEILIYDCIEFSRRFRCRDVACEIAFLAMDLDLRCFRGFGGRLLHRYAELTADPDLPLLADFYKLHLATVRGKVASLRSADQILNSIERDRSRLEAMRYIHLACSYTLPPLLILMCGLPASGKSYAARAIAQPFEATVLRSDVVRKELAGLAAGGKSPADLDAGLYTPDFTRRTYSALRDRAIEHLHHRRTVIVDATFSTAAMRKPFFEAARKIGVPCLLVEMTSGEDVIRQRMIRRESDPDEVSDAGWQVYQHAKARFEPPEELAPSQRVRLDSCRPGEEMTAAVINHLIPPCFLIASSRRVRRRR